MDNKELMICLMKMFGTGKRSRKPKDSRRLLVPGMGEAEK